MKLYGDEACDGILRMIARLRSHVTLDDDDCRRQGTSDPEAPA